MAFVVAIVIAIIIMIAVDGNFNCIHDCIRSQLITISIAFAFAVAFANAIVAITITIEITFSICDCDCDYDRNRIRECNCNRNCNTTMPCFATKARQNALPSGAFWRALVAKLARNVARRRDRWEEEMMGGGALFSIIAARSARGSKCSSYFLPSILPVFHLNLQ